MERSGDFESLPSGFDSSAGNGSIVQRKNSRLLPCIVEVRILVDSRTAVSRSLRVMSARFYASPAGRDRPSYGWFAEFDSLDWLGDVA